jgi:23S rRNA (guanosine2251-2'-O)-methyltransferase
MRERKPVPHRQKPFRPPRPAAKTGDILWLYGRHAVTAALANGERRKHRLVATENALKDLAPLPPGLAVERAGSPRDIETLLPPNAVHQGVALAVSPLPALALGDVLDRLGDAPATLLLLDQVTDPHNVGAILRSAAAFGAAAVVSTERQAAGETGALAKAASGALDIVPYLTVVNLARALEDLAKAGFWRIGLAGEGELTLEKALGPGRVVFVLGAEGSGLRRLTREHCDALARLPMPGAMESLNVSNAAAIALYEASRSR